MSTNHYFNNIRSSGEQNLLEDLTIETIKIHGMDMFYLPRTLVNKDTFFGEDPISRFETIKPIEMYLETVNGFQGSNDLLSKFGLQVKDSASFIVAKKRFQKETKMERPMEGDIVYLPLTKGLFEIKFVEHENPFYQLGKNHTFKLSVELFQFSEEAFRTGETEIDSIAEDLRFTMTLGFGATAGAGTFVVGQSVYQFHTDSTTGSYTGANATAVIRTVNSTSIEISDVVGSWLSGYFVADNANTAYRPITSITDKVNTTTYNDNADLQTKSDTIVDFTETNPFGDV
jgi:hypothetical protein